MKKKIDVAFNRRNFIQVVDTLSEFPLIPFYGTLLGLVRQGDLIENDDDIDFLLDAKYRDAVIAALVAADYEIDVSSEENESGCFLQVFRDGNGIKAPIDFYLYEEKEGFLLEKWNFSGDWTNSTQAIHIPKHLVFPTKKVNHLGRVVNMPQSPEECCRFLYGEQWLTPSSKSSGYKIEIHDNRPKAVYRNKIIAAFHQLLIETVGQLKIIKKRLRIKIYMDWCKLRNRRWVRRLLRGAFSARLSDRSRFQRLKTRFDVEIPKKIWIYWAQGWESAPELILHCKLSWLEKNPGWEVILLDNNNIDEFVSIPESVDKDTIGYTAYSDVLRAELLYKFGGVWCDATTFCACPLDNWLPELSPSGLFVYTSSSDKTLISSWFVAACKNNPVIRAQRKLVHAYFELLKQRKPKLYFWFHHLFELAIRTNRKTKIVWAMMPKISSERSHELQFAWKEGRQPNTQDTKAFVHKFDRKAQEGDPRNVPGFERFL